MSYALDISQFTPPEQVTDDSLDRCLARGIDRFMPSILDQDFARKHFAALVRKPVEIQSYRAYNWGNIRAEQPEDVKFIGEIRHNSYDLQMHWIDAEAGLSADPQANIEGMRWVIKAFEGVCPTGIYTAPSIWQTSFANTDEFKGMPVWFAHWNGLDSLDMTSPFGGWTRGAMHQTLANLMVEGIWCDTNYYERATPAPNPPPGPPIVTRPRLEYVSTQDRWDDAAGLYIVETTYREAGT